MQLKIMINDSDGTIMVSRVGEEGPGRLLTTVELSKESSKAVDVIEKKLNPLLLQPINLMLLLDEIAEAVNNKK